MNADSWVQPMGRVPFLASQFPSSNRATLTSCAEQPTRSTRRARKEGSSIVEPTAGGRCWCAGRRRQEMDPKVCFRSARGGRGNRANAGYTLVITGEVITLEMGPGSQKAKNAIGPDLRSFLGIRLSALNSNIDHQFPGNFFQVAASG